MANPAAGLERDARALRQLKDHPSGRGHGGPMAKPNVKQLERERTSAQFRRLPNRLPKAGAQSQMTAKWRNSEACSVVAN
jgi:hypothetical protein